jgi:hypothetical protein
MVTLQEKVQCWFQNDATKQLVMENKICEDTAHLNSGLRRVMTSLQFRDASARSVGWGSNEAVTLLYLVNWPSTPTYRMKTKDSKHYD